VKISTAVFQSSYPDLAACPQSETQEFALIGRSNVGKSSLINMLTHSEGLAKVSRIPGKTQLINFFLINNSWTLVDLPGYGYAKVGKNKRSAFSAFVSDYLQHRPNLVGTFVLIDSRLTPQNLDLEFITWMIGCGLPLILIFTKMDKLSKGAAQKNIDAFLLRMSEISEESPAYVLSSALERHGRSEILALIESAISEQR
jgi:GTP-binding protein